MFLYVLLLVLLACEQSKNTEPVEGPAVISGHSKAVVKGELGKSLHIPCSAYGHPEPMVFWYHGISGPMVPFESTLYKIDGNILHIKELKPETIGQYNCQAYNGIGKPATWTVLVTTNNQDGNAQGPYIVPETIQSPETMVLADTRISIQNSTVESGSELRISCKVDGFPVPDTYWTKDDTRLESTEHMEVTEAELRIYDVIPKDSGVYGCHADNQYSAHYSTVRVTVQGIYIREKCSDNPFFADCYLIVRLKYCNHKFYQKFCCKTCTKAGQLNVEDLDGN